MAARHVQLHSPHQNQHQLQAFSRVNAAHALRVQPNPRKGFVRLRFIVGRVRIVPRVRILSASSRAVSRAAADADCTRRSMAWQFLDANTVQRRVSLWTRVRLHSTYHNLSEATVTRSRLSSLHPSLHCSRVCISISKSFPSPNEVQFD